MCQFKEEHFFLPFLFKIRRLTYVKTITDQTEKRVVPAVVQADEALVELLHHGAQHGTGIVGEVQVSDLHHRDRDDGERLLVLFGGTRSQLQKESRS